jgi:broad specificity phosphatase PhoE
MHEQPRLRKQRCAELDYNRGMRLYIVRHGVTELNTSNVRQAREGYLSDEGIQQARAAAEKLSELTVDSIFTSPFPRARQTADIISAKVKQLLVQESEYLGEVRLPSELVGTPKDDPRSERILATIEEHYDDQGWRYSDEESFEEFVARAHTVLDYIARTGFENVVVVSHERFIRVLVGVMLLGKSFTPQVFREVRHNLYISNTGITICDLVDLKKFHWRLVTLNDHSHIVKGTVHNAPQNENT